MLPQFKSMNELTEYLGSMENRMKTLEAENERLRTTITTIGGGPDKNAIARYVSNSLPKTNLVSPGFLSRAFAVWGHFFVANLIVGAIATALYLCLLFVGMASFLGQIQR